MTININRPVHLQEEIDSQWLFTESDLNHTPTVLSGLMKPEEERKNRRKGASLIYNIAEKLNLYMATHLVSTAAIFFQRFFMRRCMRPPGGSSVFQGQTTFAYQDVAMASLYLATKVEECYKRLDDIVNVGLELDHRIESSSSTDQESTLRMNILWSEERLLETLCFDLIVDHPQKHLILAARKLGVDRGLTRIAYANIHDAFRDPICTMYEPEVLAAGSFALACQDVELDPTDFSTSNNTTQSAGTSTHHTWLEVFDVSQEEVDECMTALKSVREAMLPHEPKPTRHKVVSSTSSSQPQSRISSPHPHHHTMSPLPQVKDAGRPPSRHGVKLVNQPFGTSNKPGNEGQNSTSSDKQNNHKSEGYTLESPKAATQDTKEKTTADEGYTLESPRIHPASPLLPIQPQSQSQSQDQEVKQDSSSAYTLTSPSIAGSNRNDYTLQSPQLATKGKDEEYTLQSPQLKLNQEEEEEGEILD
ncbi:unnamed protein product [Sympodiomycopsis kandeliae]